MEERETHYCIIKLMGLNGHTLPVIVLDAMAEVLEFTDKDEAKIMANIMETNSDSGWKYVVKEI